MTELIRIKDSKFIPHHDKDGRLNESAFVVSKDIVSFLQQIKNGEFAGIIEQTRKLQEYFESGVLNEQETILTKREKGYLKGKLPVAYPSHYCNCEEMGMLFFPTGLYGGDIDRQDNPDVDFDLLKKELLTIKELKYLFISPSGGIKFAIKTDFNIDYYGEDKNSLSVRFRQGYAVVIEHIKKHLSQEIVFDKGMSSFFFKCFASYDPDVYFNRNCPLLKVQEYTHYKPVGNCNDVDTTIVNSDENGVYYLLGFVDRNLEYNGWLVVSAATFKFGGYDAFDKLVAHWAYVDRDRLKSDLKNIQHSVEHGGFSQVGMGTLYYYARQNPNFPKDYGKARSKNNKPGPIEMEKPKMFSVEEAVFELKRIYHDFFSDSNNKSGVVSINTGVGKTQALIEVLITIPRTKNVLVLFPTHELANQFYDDLIEARKQWNKNKNNPLKNHSSISVGKPLRGKTGKYGLCDNTEIRKKFEEAELFIPPWVCHKCPLLNAGYCKHVEQFDGFDNIRLMTHSEWTNNSNYFYDGFFEQPEIKRTVNGNKEIKVYLKKTRKEAWINKNQFDPAIHLKAMKQVWQPNYIISDEDPIEEDTDSQDGNSIYDSVRYILNDLKTDNNLTLAQAVLKHKKWVGFDLYDIKKNSEKIIESSFDHSKTLMEKIDLYISRVKATDVKRENLMVSKFGKFVEDEEDETILKGIAYDIDKGHHSLKHSRLLSDENPRYNGVPMLILDATADKRVYSEILPKFTFNKIHVKKDPLVKIYQCYDRNITLRRLIEEPVLKHIIVDGLKKIIQQEKATKVGVISYLNVKDNFDDFAQWLGDQIKSEDVEIVVAHFGAERGLNTFKDCDMVFRVGRFNNPTKAKNYARALGWEIKTSVMGDLPGKAMMYDGSVLTWKNWLPVDSSYLAANEIACRTTSIQADGRIRQYYATKVKKLFILSNECLGTNEEIDEVFKWDDYFENPGQYKKSVTIQEKAVNELFPPCFRFDRKTIVDAFGFKMRDWRDNQQKIIQSLKDLGYQIEETTVRDKGRNKKSWTFCFINNQALEAYLIDNGLTAC